MKETSLREKFRSFPLDSHLNSVLNEKFNALMNTIRTFFTKINALFNYLNRLGETSSPPPASYTPAQKTSEDLEEYKKRKVP